MSIYIYYALHTTLHTPVIVMWIHVFLIYLVTLKNVYTILYRTGPKGTKRQFFFFKVDTFIYSIRTGLVLSIYRILWENYIGIFSPYFCCIGGSLLSNISSIFCQWILKLSLFKLCRLWILAWLCDRWRAGLIVKEYWKAQCLIQI